MLRFVLAIYCRYISETLHGLLNIKTINQRDIGTIFTMSRRDIILMRLRCNNMSPQYIVAGKFVVTICHSELRFTIYHNEAIVYNESVFVHM